MKDFTVVATFLCSFWYHAVGYCVGHVHAGHWLGHITRGPWARLAHGRLYQLAVDRLASCWSIGCGPHTSWLLSPFPFSFSHSHNSSLFFLSPLSYTKYLQFLHQNEPFFYGFGTVNGFYMVRGAKGDLDLLTGSSWWSWLAFYWSFLLAHWWRLWRRWKWWWW